MNLMFNFCRVTSLVCCVRDGIKIKQAKAGKVDLKKREVAFAILEGPPSLFDFMAYMYFCGGAISGPWYEFKDFQDYCRGDSHYKQIPSTTKAALIRFCQAWMWVAQAIVLSNWFDEKIYVTQEF